MWFSRFRRDDDMILRKKNLCYFGVAYVSSRPMSYNYRNKCFIAIPVTGMSLIWTMEIKQVFDSQKTDALWLLKNTVPWNDAEWYAFHTRNWRLSQIKNFFMY